MALVTFLFLSDAFLSMLYASTEMPFKPSERLAIYKQVPCSIHFSFTTIKVELSHKLNRCQHSFSLNE